MRPPREGKQPVKETKRLPTVINTPTQQEPKDDPQPLMNLVTARDTPFSTPNKPQTPHTAEIFSTNAAGEVVITTVEVNTDFGRRDDPPNG